MVDAFGTSTLGIDDRGRDPARQDAVRGEGRRHAGVRPRRHRRARRDDRHRGRASTCRTRRRWSSSRPTASASRSCTSCAAASAAAGCPGLCLLVTEAPPGTPARERVEAVAATLDGFELAEVDLELRGEGDVLGDAQSGARSSLRLLRVVKDADLIAEARIAAERCSTRTPRCCATPASPRRSSGASAWRSAPRSRSTDADVRRRADRLAA